MTVPARAISVEPGYDELRRAMVAGQLRARGGFSPRVLDAMLRVPRHEFVPEENRAAAYTDQPLPIGEGQTISQPYIVAAMAEALELTGTERVLEVGAGSGYQAAVLSLLAREVHAIELNPGHAAAARERLARLGYDHVQVHTGDGSLGLPELAPFDAILVSAAAPGLPPPLVEQLAEAGRLVLPVGDERQQELIRVRRSDGQITAPETLHYCRFVPLLGAHGWRSPGWLNR
jgi:protein-L-isoaspartate(D-aspartate) O-methyltransferase